MIKPTVGRIVHFFPGEGTDLESRIGSGPFPAIVSAVWGDRCINVGITDGNGRSVEDPPTSVQLVQEGDECDPGIHRCRWMPYQVAKHAEAGSGDRAGSESGEKQAGTEAV